MSTTRQQLRRMKPVPGGTFWMGSADLGFRCVVRGTPTAGR
jgi:hypothetical protein